jgi:hypothetical protein
LTTNCIAALVGLLGAEPERRRQRDSLHEGMTGKIPSWQASKSTAGPNPWGLPTTGPLIELLRETHGLTGTKLVCGAGVCGAPAQFWLTASRQ